MGHVALYREWRPKTFDEVVEQHYTVAALKQAVISGQIGHAYLFSGTRGTGKTTMAQIFSRAVNCLSPVNGNPCNVCDVCKGILNGTILDVIEMDAASNNNVDTIRRICDEVIFAPSVARFKVYIIDEVHMLSTGAFNALLKTLEEPPAHAIFILATTEPHRIPATILSRCQRYEFRRISVVSIIARLRLIADNDGILIDEQALSLIARIADGALRDAISLLDQARGSFRETIGKEDILSLVGMVNDDFMHDIALSLINTDPGALIAHIEHLIMEGRDVSRFAIDLTAFYRNVMVYKVSQDPTELLTLSDKAMQDLRDISDRVTLDQVLTVIRKLSSLSSDLKWSLNPRITLEAALIQLMNVTEPVIPVEAQTAQEAQIVQPSHAKAKGNWEDILERIAVNGNMTVYLFLRAAHAVISEESIEITFDANDSLNYTEVSKSPGLSAVSAAAHQVLGREIKVNVSLQKPSESSDATDDPGRSLPAQPSGAGSSVLSSDKDSLRKSVEELGIAFYMEE